MSTRKVTRPDPSSRLAPAPTRPVAPLPAKRLWLMRLVALFVIPLMVLAGLELVLRLVGYGYDTHFFKQIQVNGRSCFVPNEEFGFRFFPPTIARSAAQFKFPADKSTNTFMVPLDMGLGPIR